MQVVGNRCNHVSPCPLPYLDIGELQEWLYQPSVMQIDTAARCKRGNITAGYTTAGLRYMIREENEGPGCAADEAANNLDEPHTGRFGDSSIIGKHVLVISLHPPLTCAIATLFCSVRLGPSELSSVWPRTRPPGKAWWRA
jgi:hypothetical protein